MENQNIKRGIDLQNRLLQSLGGRFQHAFVWWKGGKLNKNSLFFIFAIFVINLFLVYPLFSRNVTVSFSSSALLIIADLFERLGILHKSQFFSIIVFFSLSFAPISYYLFVRRVALRHELTAFLASLLFILPTPFFKDGMPLISAILNGDGAHALVFSFIPLFLLYVQAFISTGLPAWGVMSSIGTAIIAIISPFAFFNLLIIFMVVTIAEGFLGELRIKLARFLFLISASLALSFFWYHPNVIAKIAVLSHINFALKKFWSIFPLFVPIIPVLGALSFLIFDRRERLKPIFIGFTLFLIYFFLFTISKALNTNGIFIAERYLMELSFATSLFFAVIFAILAELAVRNYIVKISNNIILFLVVFLASSLIVFLLAASLVGIRGVQTEIATRPILNASSFGIGAIQRSFDFSNISSVLASLVSLVTLVFLLIILGRFSSLGRVRELAPYISLKQETKKE